MKFLKNNLKFNNWLKIFQTCDFSFIENYYVIEFMENNMIKIKYRRKVENDFMSKLTSLISDGGDRYRTAALQLSYKGNEIGFNLYTGDPSTDIGNSEEHFGATTTDLGDRGNYLGANANRYRFGAANAGRNGYRAGWSGYF